MLRNYHITNKEIGNKIIFLRKLAPGGSTHSFGIHVAKMAGMPPSLIDRANEVLKILESSREEKEDSSLMTDERKNNPLSSVNKHLSSSVKKLSAPQVQLSIFDAHSETFEAMRKKLELIDINRLTPVEALMKLNEIKEMLK